MKKLLASLSTLILTATLFTGCLPATFMFKTNSKEVYDSEKLEEMKFVRTVSKESSISFEFPENWKEDDLNDQASIEIGNEAESLYFVVLEESAEDFEKDFTLDDFTTMVLDHFHQTINSFEISEINEVKLKDNTDAMSYEFSGSVNKLKAKYLMYCFQSNNRFYQIVAWTRYTSYDNAKPLFTKIMNTMAF